jgi:hypothetical protein
MAGVLVGDGEHWPWTVRSIYFEIEQAEVVRGCAREREREREREEERNRNEAAGVSLCGGIS